MKHLTLTVLLVAAAAQFTSAQTIYDAKSAEERQMDHKDSMVIAEVIDPAINEAKENNQEPEWEGLRATVALKYDGSVADRTVTKARIYYYFGKDWPVFSKALVHYTEVYENKDNLLLMNANAKMILKYSQDPTEWKTAQAWIKHAVDKDPANPKFKETYEGLTAKIKG